MVTTVLAPGASVPLEAEIVTQLSCGIASHVMGAVPELPTVKSTLAGKNGPPTPPENEAPMSGRTDSGPATGSAGGGVAVPPPAIRNEAASPLGRTMSIEATAPKPGTAGGVTQISVALRIVKNG